MKTIWPSSPTSQTRKRSQQLKNSTTLNWWQVVNIRPFYRQSPSVCQQKRQIWTLLQTTQASPKPICHCSRRAKSHTIASKSVSGGKTISRPPPTCSVTRLPMRSSGGRRLLRPGSLALTASKRKSCSTKTAPSLSFEAKVSSSPSMCRIA